MNKTQLANYFDHTFLKPYATEADLTKLCNEAKEIGAAMVAINTTWTKFCKEQLNGTNVHVGAAISFPLGQAGLASKIAETKIAIEDGADEIDYVIDIGQAKMHHWDYIKEEMESIVSICREHNVRCNGSDGYIAWLDDVLDIRKTANPDYTFSNIASDDWIVWHLNRESLNSRARMAMISQPICGKTIEEIKATREKAVQALKEMGYEPIDVPFLEEWYNSKASLKQSSVVTVPEYFVAELFIRITRSNAIYFCKGWKNAVGCWLDHNAASAYGLKIIYEEEIKWLE